MIYKYTLNLRYSYLMLEIANNSKQLVRTKLYINLDIYQSKYKIPSQTKF